MQQTKAIVINELCPSLSSPIGAIGGLDFGSFGGIVICTSSVGVHISLGGIGSTGSDGNVFGIKI